MATITFKPQSGNWSKAASWTPAGVPNSGDTMLFADGTYTSTVDANGSWNLGPNSHLNLSIASVTLQVSANLTLGSIDKNVGLIEIGGGGITTTLTVLSNVNSAGRFDVLYGGFLIVDGGINNNNGTIVADGGDVEIKGNFSGSGIVIANSGLVSFESNLSGASHLDFGVGDGAGELLLGRAQNYSNATRDAHFGDRIGFKGVTVSGASFDGAHTLTVTTSSGTVKFSDFMFAGVTPNFVFGADIHLGSSYGYVEFACFAEGTRIATQHGNAAVESLMEGDLVATLSDGLQRIRWIGQRLVDLAANPNAAPIRIQCGAFGLGLPSRDLLLSPEHCVHIDDVLIPIQFLVNGDSIREETRRSIRYFHVELARHGVLLAENLPCESFLDTGNRDSFENSGSPMRLRPDLSAGSLEAEPCARIVRQGAILEDVYQRLLARADILHTTAARLAS